MWFLEEESSLDPVFSLMHIPDSSLWIQVDFSDNTGDDPADLHAMALRTQGLRIKRSFGATRHWDPTLTYCTGFMLSSAYLIHHRFICLPAPWTTLSTEKQACFYYVSGVREVSCVRNPRSPESLRSFTSLSLSLSLPRWPDLFLCHDILRPQPLYSNGPQRGGSSHVCTYSSYSIHGWKSRDRAAFYFIQTSCYM